MPFLFPAIGAAFCDVSIIYLRHVTAAVSDDDDSTIRRVYHFKYLYVLAFIRLFLLLVPLPYHSYHGKALKCPIMYQLFYTVTLIVVFFHILSLIMIDPDSISSIVPTTTSSSSESTTSSSNQDDNDSYHHHLITRNLWWSLLLTILSTCNHITLFFHVRSTAPSESEFQRKRQPKVLLYYVKEENAQNEDTERENLLNLRKGEQQKRIIVKSTSDSSSNNLNGKNLILNGSGSSDNESITGSTSSNRVQEISNKLVMDIQISLQKAKKEWTKRLEDYHFRSGHGHVNTIHGLPMNGTTHGSSRTWQRE